MPKFLKTVLVSAAFLVSISASAQDRRDDTHQQEQHGNHQQAYYDSKHRDWHQWNDQENQSYSRYAEHHHRNNRDFSQSSEREQQQYWSWRHKHPDSH